MFCETCGTKKVDGNCASCTAKSTGSLSIDNLEKALNDLESLGKGVRPAEAKFKGKDERTGREVVADAVEQIHQYGEHGEGDSEEEPTTEKDVEERVKGGGSKKKVFGKGGFVPPPAPEDDEEEEEEREREEAAQRGAQDGGGAPPMPFKSTKGKAKKSFADDMMEDDNVRKAVDVSPFLEGITNQLVDGYDSLRDEVTKSAGAWRYQQNYNVGLAKALGELGNLVKGLTDIVGTLAKSPSGQRKGDVTIVEKSFGNKGGEAEVPEGQQISKGAIAAKILALKEAGDVTIDDMDVFRAESTGMVRPEIQKKLGLNS